MLMCCDVQSWQEDDDGRPKKVMVMMLGDSADVVDQVEDEGLTESGMILYDGIFVIGNLI